MAGRYGAARGANAHQERPLEGEVLCTYTRAAAMSPDQLFAHYADGEPRRKEERKGDGRRGEILCQRLCVISLNGQAVGGQ